MAGYGVAEARMHERRPEAIECTQCEDTGFVVTAFGLRACPLCNEEESHGTIQSDAGNQ